jgi:RNA polymerase sigma factor (sigma-70 family)
MDLSPDSDVLAARTGDRSAFGRLVTRYSGVVTSISLSTVRDVATSEEVAQDVFFAAWRDLESLRNPASFLPWLRQLTRHRALDAARRARRPDARPAAFDDATLAAAVDPGPAADDTLIHDERTRAVSIALDALPADAREILTLFYREGRSVAQVARLLDLHEDTVKKRLSRARAALREEVLARFAEAVEATAPGDAFARQVILALPMMSPATAWVVTKAALHLLAKWATVAAAGGAAMGGILVAALPILAGIQKELKKAIDERERRELRRLGAVATLNASLFCVAIPAFSKLVPNDARLYGTLWALVFSLLHVAIYVAWLPRVQARRRAAMAAVPDDGGARADACAAKRRKWVAVLASAFVLCAVLVTWIR